MHAERYNNKLYYYIKRKENIHYKYPLQYHHANQATPISLKRLCHGQKCLHLLSDTEAYHEKMGPTHSSNGSLDIALSDAHT